MAIAMYSSSTSIGQLRFFFKLREKEKQLKKVKVNKKLNMAVW